MCAWVAADLSSTLAQHSPDSPEAILSQLLQIAASPAALSSPDTTDPNAPPSSSSSKLGGGLLSVLGRSVGGGSSYAQASSAAAQMPVGLRSANPADPNSVESHVVALLAQVMQRILAYSARSLFDCNAVFSVFATSRFSHSKSCCDFTSFLVVFLVRAL